MKISLLILRGGEIVRLITFLVCIQVIPAKATLELEAMSHMGRKLGTLGWRWTTCVGSYVVNNERRPLLAPKQTQVKMVVTSQGLEHLIVNPFLYLYSWIERSDITGKRIKVRA